MQHILNVAFDFDDATIKRKVEASAYDQIIQKLYNDVKNSLPKTYRGPNYLSFARDAAEKLIDEHKDEIIESATKALVEKAQNTKKWREAKDAAIREMTDEQDD